VLGSPRGEAPRMKSNRRPGAQEIKRDLCLFDPPEYLLTS
jgi:hypothetical protein